MVVLDPKAAFNAISQKAQSRPWLNIQTREIGPISNLKTKVYSAPGDRKIQISGIINKNPSFSICQSSPKF